MKIKDTFITYEMDGNNMIISAGAAGEFKGVVRTNPSASFIVDCLKQETSEDEIVNKMLEKYDVDEEKIRTDVRSIIDQLAAKGILDL